jgi:ribonuclease D
MSSKLRVDYTLVNRSEDLPDVLRDVAGTNLIGIDTEFVAEDCYRPDLCLLQISTRERVFIVDPKGIYDLSPLWRLILAPERMVVVHAGREEILFAYRATGQTFPKLFDVQIAAGLLGGEYPASYAKLLQRLLGHNVPKGETRTDWRSRPLTRAQLEYAALDVLHLPALYDRLSNQLSKHGRLRWLEDELARKQRGLVLFEDQEGWYRMPGVQALHGKQLSVVRELWRWRDERAKSKDMPARRVLRDDLIVELARRGSADVTKISHIRGLHHAGFQRFIPELAACISRGLNGQIPRTPWRNGQRRTRPPALLQQFLTAAMAYLCRSNRIAPAIVGTSDDVGRLAAYWLSQDRLPEDHDEYPNLLRGWRAEFVGTPLYEIYAGKLALRVHNPRDEMPLALCDSSGNAAAIDADTLAENAAMVEIDEIFAADNDLEQPIDELFADEEDEPRNGDAEGLDGEEAR